MDILQELNDEEYLNWIAVGHGLSFMCKGVRPYLQSQMLAFHQHLEGIVGAGTRCVCPGIPRHDMTRCAWAQAIVNDHFGNPRKIPWKQSDSRQWHDPELGPWQIAKLFMSDLGRHSNAVVDAETTDPTGLLNLMYWCHFLNFDRTKVDAVRQVRNEMWAHASRQRLTNDDKRDAFLSIRDLLQDTVLIHDSGVAPALEEVNRVEGMDLMSLQRVQLDVLTSFRAMMELEKDQTLERLEGIADVTHELLHFQQQQQQNRWFTMETITHYIFLTQLSVLHMFTTLVKTPWKFPFVLLCFLSLFLVMQDGTFNDVCYSMLEEHNENLDLKEFQFTTRLCLATEGFTGRQWLFREMEEIFEKNSSTSSVLVHGPPGSGKSALTAKLICSNTSSVLIHGSLLGYHVCSYYDKKTRDAKRFVRNLARMIASAVPEYRDKLQTNSELRDVLEKVCPVSANRCFQDAILDPLKLIAKTSKERRMRFVIIDALDECRDIDSELDIVQLVRRNMERFPDNVKLIMTSRPLPRILNYFRSSRMFEISPTDLRNLEDINLYTSQTLYKFFSRSFPLQLRHMVGLDETDKFQASVELLLNQSQGNFLFVKETIHYWLENFGKTSWFISSPVSLSDTYQKHFERAFPTEERFESIRPILQILVASLIPLSQNELFNILRLRNSKLDFEDDFIPILEKLSHIIHQGQVVTIYHQAVVEWLTERKGNWREYRVSKRKGCKVLASYNLNALEDISAKDKEPDNDIALSHEMFLLTSKYISCAGMVVEQVKRFSALPSRMFNGTLPSQEGRTTLHAVTHIANPNITRLVATHFFTVDVKDERGLTPAFFAAISGNREVLMALDALGANLSYVSKTSCSEKPCFMSRIRGCLRRFVQDSQKLSPFRRASLPSFSVKPVAFECNGTFLYNFFEKHPCNISILSFATLHGHTDVVTYLFKKKIHNIPNEEHRFPLAEESLQIAVLTGNAEAARLICDVVGIKPKTHQLYFAAVSNHTEMVRVLLLAGVRDVCVLQESPWLLEHYSNGLLQYTSNTCVTALNFVSQYGFTEVARLLVDFSESSINFHYRNGLLPIQNAILNGHQEIVRIILNATRGATAYATCKSESITTLLYPGRSKTASRTDLYECPCGFTSFHFAAKDGLFEITKDLVSWSGNLNINFEDCNGATPLHIAACHSQTAIFSLLAQKGADVNYRSKNGSTPYHSAAVCGATEIFGTMDKLKADPLLTDNNGMSILHYTVKDIHTPYPNTGYQDFDYRPSWPKFNVDERRIMKNSLNPKWLESFATLTTWLKDVNLHKATDTGGQTVLHVISYNGLREAVRFLFDWMTNEKEKAEIISIEDNYNQTAIDKVLTGCENSSWSPHWRTSPAGQLLTGDYDDVMSLVLMYSANTAKSPIKIDHYLHRAISLPLFHSTRKLLEIGENFNSHVVNGKGTPFIKYLRSNPFNIMGFYLVQDKAVPNIKIECDHRFQDSSFHMLAYRMHDFVSFFYAPSKIDWSNNETDARFYSLNCYLPWHPLFLLRQNLKEKNGPLASSLTDVKLIDTCKDKTGYNPLHRASQGANIAAVNEFLQIGANPNILTPEGYSSIHLTILYASTMQKPFSRITENCDAELASMVALRLLRETISKGNYSALSHSLTCGREMTLYHLAAARGLSSFIYYLHSEQREQNNKTLPGIDIHCNDKNFITPLYLANLYGKSEKPFSESYQYHSKWSLTKNTIIKDLGSDEQIINPVRVAELFLFYNCLSLKENVFNPGVTETALQSLKENLKFPECRRQLDCNDYSVTLSDFICTGIVKRVLCIRNCLKCTNMFCIRAHTDLEGTIHKINNMFPRLRAMCMTRESMLNGNLQCLKSMKSFLYKNLYLFATEPHKLQEVLGIISYVKTFIRCPFAIGIGRVVETAFKLHISKRPGEGGVTYHYVRGNDSLRCNTTFMAERMGLIGKNKGFQDAPQGWPLEFIIKIALNETKDLDYLHILNEGFVPPL